MFHSEAFEKEVSAMMSSPVRGIPALPSKFLRKLGVLAMALALSGCSAAPQLVGMDNPDVPALSVSDVTRHRIFIATTRQASDLAGVFYGEGRAPELGLASVDVTVPPNHVLGQLERPMRLPPDPRSEFAIIDPSVYQTDSAFVTEINRDLASRPRTERQLLLFVHGYNTSTTDAILRLGQFVEDTKYQGVPVLITWASAAKLTRYVYDLNSALIARDQLIDIADILKETRAESVDIFAHSMGTFLTMEALVNAQQTGRLGKSIPIDNIMLAAPDIDIDLFRTQIAILPPSIREKMFILISKDDGALRVSRRIAGGIPRVGAADATELEPFGVTVIDLSEIQDTTSTSHNKFASSPEVVQLVGAGLNEAATFGGDGPGTLTDFLAGAPIRIFGN